MTDTPTLPPGQETAIACVVAPERLEDAVAALTSDQLLPALWWAGELVKRANALKKALTIEAQVALEHGEVEPETTLAGKRYVFRQDSRNDFDDVSMLFQELANLGFKPYSLGRAVGYLRITSLQEMIREVTQDEDIRKSAYDLIEEHRSRKPTGFALVDLDSPYRRRP